MNKDIKFPFYVRFAFSLISLALITAFLYVSKQIVIPILMALLFAILLRPIVSFFNKKLRFPHVISVTVSVILFVLVIGSVIFFVSWKIGDMTSDWDNIKSNLSIHYHNIQSWIKEQFNISYRQQEKYIQQASKDSLPGTEMVGNTLSSFTDIVMNFVLIPIYVFLFLLYRNLFLKFLAKLFKDHRQKLQEILFEVKSAIQSYLVGILIEVGIVSILTSVGLSIVGVKYAILLGIITGVLNLIPYIGILFAACLSIVATLTTSAEISIIAGVIIVNVVVQLLDNNVLVPMIVSSKVKINAFISIVSIIIGGAIADVAGMFLAIPMIAILKVIFDRVETFEPWGFLMGDDLPKTYEFGKIKLPQYDAGSSEELESDSKEDSEKTKEKE